MIRKFLKIMSAGMMAFLILNFFCLFYYNIPRHLTNETGVTDYRWEYHYRYSRGTEGYSKGQMNNEGYNNSFDYQNQKINHLVLGTSHMEAINVRMDENVSSKLNTILGGQVTYNLGMSGHDFYTVAGNLKAAVERYQPDGYVLIELDTVQLNVKDIKKVNESIYPEIPSYDSGILFRLQRFPYLRLLYSQLKSAGKPPAADADTEITQAATLPDDENIYYAELNQALAKIKAECDTAGARGIIYYHPHIQLNEDGSATSVTNKFYNEAFRQGCEKNGIIYLDLAERFLSEYNERHILPHGFSNTRVGKGHLNREGHRMIAEELVKVMKKL